MKNEGIHREQLLLAAMSSAHQSEFSPVQIQKLMFLLDKNVSGRLGGPLYAFKPYHYGPFDAAVYRDLEEQARVGNVEIVESGKGRKYVLTNRGRVAGEYVAAELSEDVRAYLSNVAHFVQRQPFAQLVSSIYRHYPEMRENSVFKP